MQKILIIANARRKGGLSGGDNIYLNFIKHWPIQTDTWDMLNIDFKPFCLCYVYRIIVSIIYALKIDWKCDAVYAASDFLMDSIPAWIIARRKKVKLFMSLYLEAPKGDILYTLSQWLATKFIKRADIVFITNDTMKHLFPGKKTISVQGGVDLELAGTHEGKRIYTCAYVGRIHPSKGIKDLAEIWKAVRCLNKDATLAFIGDGDLGVNYARKLGLNEENGVSHFGFMGKERFGIYKSSSMVLYPAKSHMSMSPVEAMACGCVLIAFKDIQKYGKLPKGLYLAENNLDYADNINWLSSVDNEYLDIVRDEMLEWAAEWDWKKRTAEIWDQLHGV